MESNEIEIDRWANSACRAFEYADLPTVDALIEGLHEIQLNRVGFEWEVKVRSCKMENLQFHSFNMQHVHRWTVKAALFEERKNGLESIRPFVGLEETLWIDACDRDAAILFVI